MTNTSGQTLTRMEKQIATCIGAGKSFLDIENRFGVTRSTLRVHIHNVRRKTGISDLATNPKRITQWLEREEATAMGKRPLQVTGKQRAVLLLWTRGTPYDDICTKLNIAYSTALNHVSVGCKRLGVSWLPRESRAASVRKLLFKSVAEIEDPMNDPMF